MSNSLKGNKKVTTSMTIDPDILLFAQHNAWEDRKSLSEVIEGLLDKYNKSKPSTPARVLAKAQKKPKP